MPQTHRLSIEMLVLGSNIFLAKKRQRRSILVYLEEDGG